MFLSDTGSLMTVYTDILGNKYTVVLGNRQIRNIPKLTKYRNEKYITPTTTKNYSS